jgi:DNA polymerase III delta subunit
MNPRAEGLPASLARGERPAVVLVHGDLVLAEAAALRVAELLAGPGVTVEVHRRPAHLADLLQDLRTFSLFSPAKVILAVDSATLADRTVAADLIDEAAEALPLGDAGNLSASGRQGAARLLQALALFELDAAAGNPEEVLGGLPAWALEGGSSRRGRGGRGRGRKLVEELRTGLAELLASARREGLETAGRGDIASLAEFLRGGAPPGHALVLAERLVAADHPIVKQLTAAGAVLAVGEVTSERGAWEGLEQLAATLERETGVGIRGDALAELGRRTLRASADRRPGGGGLAESDSSARVAGLAEQGPIDRALVELAVEDRGDEDVWQLLDAIAVGRGGEALDRLHRLLAGADDLVATRLSCFALLAGFCRQLTAIRGLLRLQGVPPGEANYQRFKTQLAPRLQAEIAGGKNPLAGLHPFRLHRAYLAASRMPERLLAELPGEVLSTELQLKGMSGEPDAALARFVAQLSSAARSGAR